jgi:methylmalonyl-CoA mutase N-terminal domain/subunit
MRERFHARDPRSLMLRFHTQTAGSTLTAQQPEVNVVRTTIQALAAVLGGTQSLHTNAMDEALALPTEEAARLALRTQRVIARIRSCRHSRSAGGSYAIEELTTKIERAVDYLDKISAMGGTLRAIETGYISAIQKQPTSISAVETDDVVVLGVNRFQKDGTQKLRVDPTIEGRVERYVLRSGGIDRRRDIARGRVCARRRVLPGSSSVSRLMQLLAKSVTAAEYLG